MSLSKQLFMQERESDSLLQSTKDERLNFAMAIVDEVSQGNKDAMSVLISAKKGIDIFELIEKNVRPYVASVQIQKGGIDMFNAKIIEKSDPDKYDFSVCGDSYYDNMVSDIAILKEKIKEREAFLKTLKEPIAITTGDYAGTEIIPPTITFGKQNIAVSLK